MKTVLVTGATGFIGNMLCAYLLDAGFVVRALTRQLQPISQNKKNIEYLEGDITKPETLINICDGIDIVFHLAGFAHAFEEENPDFQNLHHQVNYVGTINLLNESKRAGVKRFIYFSSVKACAERDAVIDETWEQWPTDAYGIAKRKSENAVLSICLENEIIPLILRPSLVYGVNVKGNLAAMLKGIAKGYFPVPPPIQNHRSMVSLDDLCRAALLAAQVENPKSFIFIVSDGVAYSTAKIVQIMRDVLGKKKSTLYLPLFVWHGLAKIGDLVERVIKKRLPINTQAVNKLFSNAAYSSQFIKNELQFEPRFSLQDILPLMVKAQKGE